MLTPLEQAVLIEFQKAFSVGEFPSPDEMDVVGRENTGAGRFTQLRCNAKTLLTQPCTPDIKIEMEGLQHGLGCLLFFEGGVPDTLDLRLLGDTEWDGIERPWRIVHPESSPHA